MPEQLLSAPEQHEALPTPEQHELLTVRTEKRSEKPGKASAELAQEARKAINETKVENSASSARERLREAGKAPREATPQHINKQLKQITLRREMASIRRKLPAPQRALSRVIHQPAIRAVSEAAGRTVSRPSGLLGGGLVAFIGSTGYYFLANRVGMEYQPAVFLALFGGGFVVGLILEFLVYAATAHRRVTD